MSEERITELEIKVTFQERLITSLNEVVIELRRELDAVRERVAYLESAGAAAPGGSDERPPHY